MELPDPHPIGFEFRVVRLLSCSSTKTKEPILPCCLTHSCRGRRDRFMPFAMVIARKWMQKTRLEFELCSFCADNCYTYTLASIIVWRLNDTRTRNALLLFEEEKKRTWVILMPCPFRNKWSHLSTASFTLSVKCHDFLWKIEVLSRCLFLQFFFFFDCLLPKVRRSAMLFYFTS